jgi:superfamily II DNA or RNA helicase
MNLRDYQETALTRVRTAMLTGKRRQVLVLPTGGGKTATASEAVRRAVAGGHQVLWFCHRAELVDQAADTLTRFGLTCGAICPGAQTPPNPYAPVQVATVQTLLARNVRPNARLIVADEAHHYVSDEWITLLNDYPNIPVLGLTATPERSDGRGLGELFDGLVVGATIRQLTETGHLVPCEILRPARPLGPGELAQNPVDAFVTHARDRRTIVFARSVELADEYTAEFRLRGIEARCIHGETPWAERSLYIDAFRRGTIPVLVNVFVLTEGFDAPETSCVILARGCSSAGTYLQMIGRALRPATGKRSALLLDLRGVSHELGEPADERVYSLDGKGIRLRDENVYCPTCGSPREVGEPCPSCGWKPSVDEARPDRVTGDPLVKFAAKRAEDEDARAATLARWMRTAHEKGYKPGWLRAKYAAVYGAPPSPDLVAAARQLMGAA